MIRSPFPFTALLLAASALTLTSCRDPKITTYSAPKDPAPTAQPPANSAAVPANSATSPAPSLTWKTPAAWQEQPTTSVRLGSFLITGENDRRADVAITMFGGTVGGDLANVNRWRAQLELAPLTESALDAALTHLDLPAGHFDVVDLTSERPLANSPSASAPSTSNLSSSTGDERRLTRTLTAWLKQPERTWFIKMTGDEALVGAQRETFLAFLRSLTFGPPTAASSAPPAPLPKMPPMPGSPSPAPATTPAAANSAAGPMSSASLPASAVSAGNALEWTAPAGWTPKPLGTVRKGSFSVRSPDASAGEADLSITAFPGTVGGLLENINRWRGQIQLPPVNESELATITTPLTSGPLTFTLVDLGTAANAQKILGAVLPVGEQTYFFKLMGPSSVVEAQKPAFLAFLQTVKTR